MGVLPVCLGIMMMVAAVVGSRSPVHHCCLEREIIIETYQGAPPLFMEKHNQSTGFVADLLNLVADEMGFKLTLLLHSDADYFNKFKRFFQGRSTAILDSSLQRLETYLWQEKSFGPDIFQFGQHLPSMVSVQIVTDSYGAALRKTVALDSGWRLFNPFTKELWLAILLTIIIFAALLVILQLLEEQLSGWQERPVRYRVQKCWKALYHGFAAFLGGEDYEFMTWPGRTLRTGMLFFVLVTTATYTANLAAFFTAPAVRIHGPQSMRELQDSIVHTSNNFYQDSIAPFVKDSIPGYNMDGTAALGEVTSSNQEQALMWGLDLLDRGEAVAYVTSLSELQFFARDRCGSIAVAEHVRFGRTDYLLFFNQSELELSQNFSVALDWVFNQPAYSFLQDKYFGVGSACTAPSSELQSVSAGSQRGLFVIFACFAGAALFLALSQAAAGGGPRADRLGLGAAATKTQPDSEDRDATGQTEGEMLLALLQRVDDLRHSLASSTGSHPGRHGDAGAAGAALAGPGLSAPSSHSEAANLNANAPVGYASSSPVPARVAEPGPPSMAFQWGFPGPGPGWPAQAGVPGQVSFRGPGPSPGPQASGWH